MPVPARLAAVVGLLALTSTHAPSPGTRAAGDAIERILEGDRCRFPDP
ncbi:MAG: hypothetical protein ABIY46_07600 [Gemmatimonadales bacterium]